jgi:2-C-methyl-D-erythritol 2,4-cyclodiphosphate synthase
MGSIGEHFPEKDPKNHGADSLTFLEYCRELLDRRRAKIVNIDVIIICESPKISPLVPEMKLAISRALGISPSAINIKGKTTEGMGFEGRKEGISAQAIISIIV